MIDQIWRRVQMAIGSLLLFSIMASSIASFEAASAIPTAASQIKMAKSENSDDQRLFIPVFIGGQGPFQFLVDTGAERTVVSRQLVTQLNLPISGTAMVQGVAGIRPAELTSLRALDLGSHEVGPLTAPILLEEDIGAAGMLGLDGMREAKLRIDFKAGQMEILPSIEKVKKSRNSVTVKAKERDGRLVITKARTRNRNLTIIIDTGAQYSIGNIALRNKLSRVDGWVEKERGTIHAVTGDTAYAEIGLIYNLAIGDITMQNAVMAFSDAPIFDQMGLKDKPAILLGMNALRLFDQVLIDFSTGAIRFELDPKAAAQASYSTNSQGLKLLEPTSLQLIRSSN